MKFVFSALHFANFRNFESVVRGLAERGHQVHLIADEPETFGGQALVERIAAEHPQVTFGWAPALASEPWHPFAQKVRYALDYVRFLAPRYADAPKLRIRNIERTPRLVTRVQDFRRSVDGNGSAPCVRDFDEAFQVAFGFRR